MSAKEVPTKFLGTFKHERSENFDEYLASKSVPWLIRKMITFTPVTKVIEKAKSQSESQSETRYNFYNRSMKENTAYENWELGQSFEAKGLDGKQHRIVFDMSDGGTLTEAHFRLDNPSDKGEVYQYTVDGDSLVLKLENESVTCKRFFKRAELQ